MNKTSKFLLKSVALIGGVTLTSMAVDKALKEKEKEYIKPYGHKVYTSFGGMNVEIVGNKGPVIVLLSGLGTVTPILDFRPLAKELSTFAKVITIEYYGYGYSDMALRPRSISNITQEIHEVLMRLNVDKYYLMPHSVSAVYSLYYALQHSNEVLGILSIDGSVPEQIDYIKDIKKSKIMAVLKTTGLQRVVDLLFKNVITPDAKEYKEDIKQIKAQTFAHHTNFTIQDEENRIYSNFNACRGLSYPKEMPVLMFISTQTSNFTKGWWQKLHERQIASLDNARIMLVEGNHHLHRTNSKLLAKEVSNFLNIDSESL